MDSHLRLSYDSIEQALLKIADEEMLQIERPIQSQLVDACHAMLFGLRGQHLPADEVMEQSLQRVKRQMQHGARRRSALRFVLRSAAILTMIILGVLIYDSFATRTVLEGSTTEGGKTYEIRGRLNGDPVIEKSAADAPYEPDMVSTTDLAEAAAVLGCMPDVPDWLPEGWTLSSYFAVSSSETRHFTAQYAHPQQHEYLKYNWSQFMHPEAVSSAFPQDGEGKVESWNGQEVYLTTNEGYNLVIWTEKNLECFIGGPASFEELRRVYNSIWS